MLYIQNDAVIRPIAQGTYTPCLMVALLATVTNKLHIVSVYIHLICTYLASLM